MNNMNTYTITAVPHWAIPEDCAVGHIYFSDRVLKEALEEINQCPGSVLFGSEAFGRIVPDSVLFRNGIFSMDIQIKQKALDELPNFADHLFCLVPTTQSFDSAFSTFTQQVDGTLEVSDVCLGYAVVVCDQLYRPQVKLLSLISRIKTDGAMEAVTYGAVSTPQGPSVHRIHAFGSMWCLDTEMPEYLKNPVAVKRWYP